MGPLKMHLPAEGKILDGLIGNFLRLVQQGECAQGIARGFEFYQPPMRGDRSRRPRTQQGRRALRMSFNVKRVQRHVQPQAFAFQQRFLAGPATIEPRLPRFRREISQGEQLARREMALSDIPTDGPNHLNVHPQLVAAAYREGRDPGAVGQIEVEAFRILRQYLWLAIRIVREANRRRGNIGITTQQSAHHGVGAHKTVSVLGKDEAAATESFFLAENFPVVWQGRNIQVPCPDMDLLQR